MVHDPSVFLRIGQVTRPVQPAPQTGPRPMVIVPGESRYQRNSARLPAQPGSLRSEAIRPRSMSDLPTSGFRRRELTHPAPGRTVAAVRRAINLVVRRRH